LLTISVMGSFFFALVLDYGGSLTEPQIRISHPIKCSVPMVKNKKIGELEPNEKTL